MTFSLFSKLYIVSAHNVITCSTIFKIQISLSSEWKLAVDKSFPKGLKGGFPLCSMFTRVTLTPWYIAVCFRHGRPEVYDELLNNFVIVLIRKENWRKLSSFSSCEFNEVDSCRAIRFTSGSGASTESEEKKFDTKRNRKVFDFLCPSLVHSILPSRSKLLHFIVLNGLLMQHWGEL